MSKTTATTVTLTTGLDLGDRTTHLCTLDPEHKVVERIKFPTTRKWFVQHFAGKPVRKIVLEAGSQSLWISHLLRELGHDVMVVDAQRIKLITESHRKTDRRDAEILARLAIGIPELLGSVQHRTLEMQADLAVLRSRDQLVKCRTGLVLHIRGQLKTFGIKVPSCSAGSFYRRSAEYIPESLPPALAPMLTVLESIEREIRELDKLIENLGDERYPDTENLQQVCGVGKLISIAFVLTIADPKRFRRSRDVAAWIGLVPRQRSSGDGNPQLRITKHGDRYLRRLLVTAAQYILGPFGKDSDLRRYGLEICRRGGLNAKKRAVVAVARKLAVLLHRLWITGAAYEPLRNSSKREAVA